MAGSHIALHDITWQSLLPHLRGRIATARRFLEWIEGEMKPQLPPEDAAETVEQHAHRLHELEWLEPLVEAMEEWASVQTLAPMLSNQTIRLFRAHTTGEEFAWIDAIGEGRFFLRRARYIDPYQWDSWPVCEGDFEQIAVHLDLMIAEEA
jgi:hypothetical protein